MTEEKDVINFFTPMIEQKNSKIHYKTIHGGDHFFRDKIHTLSSNVDQYLQDATVEIRNSKSKLRRAKYTRNKPLNNILL